MVQHMCLSEALPRLYHPSIPWMACTLVFRPVLSSGPHTCIPWQFVVLCCASPLLIRGCSPLGHTTVLYFRIHDACAGESLDKYGNAPKQSNDAGIAREDRGGTRRIWKERRCRDVPTPDVVRPPYHFKIQQRKAGKWVREGSGEGRGPP
jgi:hypothetical protein